ncbi:MAG: vapC, partial [Caulobacteraceae bacterium]|nr:vapC [Caulobacteraceae bacterium]
MLDTNIVSAIMRDPGGALTRRIASLNAPVSVSLVVAAELRYGAARKGSARLIQAVEQVLEAIEIEPLAAPVDRIYGRLREALERQGQPMDAN